MEKLAVSVVEAAKLLSISKSLAYGLIEEKRLPALRISEKRLIVPMAALREFIEGKSDDS